MTMEHRPNQNNDIADAIREIAEGFGGLVHPDTATPHPTESPEAPSEPVFPDSETLKSLLATALYPFPGEKRGVPRYLVQGHPDLYVRLVDVATHRTMRVVKSAVENMGEYINCLPVHLEQCRDRLYVVTKRVTGSSLVDALHNNPSDELIQMTDETFQGLADCVSECRRTGKYMPSEALTREQCMYGTTDYDPVPKIWFVDIPEDCESFTATPTTGELSASYFGYSKEHHYDFSLLWLANEIVTTESETGRAMPNSRLGIQRALAHANTKGTLGNAVANAVLHVLQTGEEIDVDSISRILRLRTN
jgi:hypothetical protein